MLERSNRHQNGWIKSQSRRKGGKVWVGYWNAYVDIGGARKKLRKERVIGLCAKRSYPALITLRRSRLLLKC